MMDFGQDLVMRKTRGLTKIEDNNCFMMIDDITLTK